MMDHAEAAARFTKDEGRTKWHDETLWFVRQKRDKAAHTVPDWENLRNMASQIKAHTLSDLSSYLVEFEEKATKNGIKVHWAADAHEHNEIVYSIMKENNIRHVVKSKSMLTEECHLNPFLASKGIDVVD